ncbi:MAG TPA: DUF6776 family protein [Gammaproteobacteria bacterium]|nr:DUF6776 family protein [Gammaproteobacteria bacterium]
MDRRYASLVLLLHPNRGRPRTLYIRRVLFYLVVLAVLAGVPGAIWGAFELGQVWREQSIAHLEDQADRLAAEKARTQDQLAQLRDRVGELESAKAIRSGEVRKLRQLMSDLQGRINDLQDEVGFYRSILDPEKASRDASVKDLHVRPVDGAGQDYAYTFKLVQGVAKKDPVRGYVRLAVAYLDADHEEKTLFFPEGSRYRKRGQKVEFRYFQNFSGRIELPEKAEPLRVTVQLYARHSLGELLSQTHAWEKLVQAQGKEDSDAAQKT